MTPHEFITKWRASELKERSASQEHFIDLCRLLGEPTPVEADPTGETYCFERGARKATGGDGWADVWKRHHFAWEYKGRRADLNAAFEQLRQYSLALENPPLLIVSDMVRFRIRTNWTNSVSQTHEFELDDLADAATRDRLKWPLSSPDRLRPGETRQSLTERAASSFAAVAQAFARARSRPADGRALRQPARLLHVCRRRRPAAGPHVHADACAMRRRLLRSSASSPASCPGDGLRRPVGFEAVAWFNGGLFDDADALPLERSDVETVLAASALDWSEVDPSILGTLFERGLDPRQARPARRALYRPGQDHAAGRAGGDPPAARRVGGRENRDRRGARTCGSRQGVRHAHETSKGSRAAVPGVSQPAARVHGARPGLRLGQLPPPRAAGARARSTAGTPSIHRRFRPSRRNASR